ADGSSMAVLFGPDGHQFGPAAVVAPGVPVRLAMNAAGDASLVTSDHGVSGVATHMTFRPAGGAFGAPVALEPEPAYAGTVEAFALSPQGESLLGVTAANPQGYSYVGLAVFSRDRDGPVSRFALDDQADMSPFGAGAAFAFDALGRALAVYARHPGVFTAVRAQDGTWSPPTPVPGLQSTYATNLDADVDASGDAVVAIREQMLAGRVSVIVPGATYLSTGSLADGVFAPATLIERPATYGSNLDVASAANGSTVVAWSDIGPRTVRVVQRSQTGPFSEPEIAACGTPAATANPAVFAQPAPFAVPSALLMHDGLAHNTPGRPSRCHRPARLRLTPNPAVAGRPVTLDARSLRDRTYDVSRVFFTFGRRSTEMAGLRIRHTFARPGTYRVAVRLHETDRHDGASALRRATFKVRVARNAHG
ncbi:MAG: hypothetical protein QOF76_5319, partial [Solirubrobacteraceae bacterium]|nr:hypothetical protein [Solirubrobacteraceae bacterium]